MDGYPNSPATPEMYDFADELATDFARNFDLLRGDTPEDIADEILHAWALYLGILALDVFKSIVELLKIRRERAAKMLLRSLIDYDIRLRYYAVQAMKPRQGMARNPNKDQRIFLDQMHAVLDWERAKISLGKKLGAYAPDAWPDDVAQEIQKILDAPDVPIERGFRQMARWLLENEVKVRGVPAVLPKSERLPKHYVNSTAEWLMASLIMHGDSGGNSDVFEFGPDFKPTSTVWYEPPGCGAKPLLFDAIGRLHTLIETLSMIRPWSYGLTFHRAKELWFSTEH